MDNIDFTRYSIENPPTLAEDLTVSVVDADNGKPEQHQSDLIVLTTPPVASEGNEILKEHLGVC